MFRSGLLIYLGLTVSAGADESFFKESIMENQAEVMAFVDLCDFRLNKDLAEVAMTYLGIDLDDEDRAAMEAMATDIAGRLSGFDRKALCLAGEIMYGPDGLSTPDMLSPR